jgi:hypothetical protein
MRFFRSTGEYIVGVGGGGGLFIIFGQRKQLLLPQLEQRNGGPAQVMHKSNK